MAGVTVSGPYFWEIDVESVRLNVEDPGTVEIREDLMENFCWEVEN